MLPFESITALACAHLSQLEQDTSVVNALFPVPRPEAVAAVASRTVSSAIMTTTQAAEGKSTHGPASSKPPPPQLPIRPMEPCVVRPTPSRRKAFLPVEPLLATLPQTGPPAPSVDAPLALLSPPVAPTSLSPSPGNDSVLWPLGSADHDPPACFLSVFENEEDTGSDEKEGDTSLDE